MFTPNYTISPELLQTIKQVTILVHELNKVTIPAVVLTDMIAEATAVSTYASTSIEGNPLPLTEVKRLIKNRPDSIRQSEQEVLNYNQVLTELSANWAQPFTTELLLSIHDGVMVGLLPPHQTGQWRREPVVVHNPQTREVIYLPPDWEDVPVLMDELVGFVQADQTALDPLLLAGLVHKQLVIIHPFVDGNGRTTRLATNILLAGLGIHTFNLFSFENYYNQNVSRYFQQVGVVGNYYDLVDGLEFTPWLEYFAEGVLDELRRVEKQLSLVTATPDLRLRPYHQTILDFIDTHGFITDRDYAQLTDRAKATRALDFKKLVEMGLIIRQGKGPGTYYQRQT
ncbi:MAG: Fic family protein [Anaerolineae bacterium]|nr:Fic family protein [Anaerolineae bacterium]